MAKNFSGVFGIKSILNQSDSLKRVVLIDKTNATWTNGKILVRNDPNIIRALGGKKSLLLNPENLYYLRIKSNKIFLGEKVRNKEWERSLENLTSDKFRDYPKIESKNVFKEGNLYCLELPGTEKVFTVREDNYSYLESLGLKPANYMHLKESILVYFNKNEKDILGACLYRLLG